MKHISIRSRVLVGVQFVCMGSILLPGPWVAVNGWFFALELLGILLLVWAVITMRTTKVNVFPEVRTGSGLVTNGPYRWIRHPMYTAGLMISLALVCEAFSYWRGVCWFVLCVNLVVKLSCEERFLGEVFDDYEAYRLRTWRLVPWLF